MIVLLDANNVRIQLSARLVWINITLVALLGFASAAIRFA
jgi:hypothetical protein